MKKNIKILNININSKVLNGYTINNKYYKNKYSYAEHYLIRFGLKKYFNILHYELYYTSNGKPYLDNEINISISHDNDIVIVALSKYKIGVDIQYYRNIDDKYINEFIRLLKISNKTKLFVDFSKKEAIIKLEGKKLKDINSLSLNDYNYIIKRTTKYVLVCAYDKRCKNKLGSDLNDI